MSKKAKLEDLFDAFREYIRLVFSFLTSSELREYIRRIIYFLLSSKFREYISIVYNSFIDFNREMNKKYGESWTAGIVGLMIMIFIAVAFVLVS